MIYGRNNVYQIAKQCEVAGKSSILNGCLKKSFSSVNNLGERFFGHPSRIDDFPCNLTQFCYRSTWTPWSRCTITNHTVYYRSTQTPWNRYTSINHTIYRSPSDNTICVRRHHGTRTLVSTTQYIIVLCRHHLTGTLVSSTQYIGLCSHHKIIL